MNRERPPAVAGADSAPPLEARADAGAGAPTPALVRIADVILGTDPRRRIRLQQWLISALVYAASVLVLGFGMGRAGLFTERLLPLLVFLVAAMTGFFLALRSGWSERFADPALTAAQIVLGVLVVIWGYVICGPVRSVTLLPLLLIFAFGAFSLSWRRIMWLTVFALVSLVGTVLAMHAVRTGPGAWSLGDAELHLDLTNLLMIVVVLPALSLVAAHLSELRSKLRSQRSALTQALAEVRRLATHDELTGLANRRHMQDRLALEQIRFQRTGQAFSIAIIDLDHFKHINDTRGHAGGDEVLRAFADQAQATVRACDLMARWGGEEFLLLMPGTSGAQALASVQRLLVSVGQVSQAEPPLSFSAGVTEYRRDETVIDTVARADREMYEAKRAGRNTVRLQ